MDDPAYVPFTTGELVREAHRADMAVIPLTVNHRATVESLIDVGVDGIITDRPDPLRTITAEHRFKLPKSYRPPRR